MMGSKQLIRTYQRKTVKNPSSSSLALPVQMNEKYDYVENMRKCFNRSGVSNESLNYDPFETTFDRLAKGAVVPPLPPNVKPSDSWNGSSSSSDSDINNVINIKSGDDEFTSFTCNSTSSLIHQNVKLVRKCKRPQYKLNAVTSKKTSKKTRAISTKAEIQSKIKAQEQEKRTSKIRKRKKMTQSKSKKSSSNERSKSDTTSSLKDITYENVSRSDNIKHSHEKIFETDKMKMLPHITLDNFVTDLKYISNHLQNIKPCFVKLNDCSIQNLCVLNTEKNVANKQNISTLENIHDRKLLQTNEDTSKIVHNTILQSISSECNDVIGNLKNISLKSCSVILCDNIVGNYSKKCINSSLNAHGESMVSNSVFHNSSKIISHRNNNVKLAIRGHTERNNENIIKESFVRVEKLKIEEFVKKDSVPFNEKERYIISSTPIDKRIRPLTYSVLVSPIDIKNTSSSEQNCSVMTEKDVSNIAPSHKYPKKIRLSNVQLKNCKLDVEVMQEQQTQVLLSSQNTQIEDFAVKTETISPKENIHTALTQKWSNIEHDIEILSHPLNTSAGTDQSRSLFSDTTTYNYNYSMQNRAENEIKKNTDEMVSFSVDLHSEQKQLLSNNAYPTDTNLRYKLPFKACMTLQNTGSIIHARQKQNDKVQGNAIVTFLEDFKNETIDDSKHSLLGEDQDNTNIANIDGLLKQLQDSTRITARKIRYPKQQYLNMPNISESSNHENMQSNNEIFHYVVSNEDSNLHQQSGVNSLERLKNMNLNMPVYQFESFNSTQQYSDSINRQRKSVFLKPGKSWTRSLSILNNINNGYNLDKLSIGKGKKWRNSVRDLLDMQKEGPDVSNISLFDMNEPKTFNSMSHIRFSKRISVRVVLNDTGVKHDVKDISFLEAFGISTENSSNSKLSHQTQSATHDNLIRKHSITAKDVVLKKCSQQCYLFFSECFPDSYLEHCYKIGEGVYGEVFLYDYNNRKSVIKIIPIEGEELVNGEPQKKFNEILSEIVIAKELDNLRLNSTCRTRGFVEVKGIKCIIGKYPEKLVKLWNIYDEEKTSDNDCPSMFSENQLYIALELAHGGEDLEAFIFQTAKEACSLFSQIALALAVAEKALEFEHRDLHWGNVLISRTKDKYVYYNLDGKEIRLPSNGIKVSIIDFTLSRMLYQECCIYNDLALDPALFTAYGEYQFEIYRLMRDKIQNNWQKFEPYTNILWLHYILDKMITMVRYKRKNLKIHKHAIARLKELKNLILNYDSAYDFVIDSNNITCDNICEPI